MTQSRPLIASIRFQASGKLYDFDATGHDDLKRGDFALVETVRGRQLGEVISVRPMHGDETKKNLKPIERRATGGDLAIRQQRKEQEKEALALTEKLTKELNLPMKPVVAEYNFDGDQVTILYTADNKPRHTNRLRRRLRSQLNVRVDLHRIGPRDEAKLLGGYGACGEPRCCSRFLCGFKPISIKMAKKQGVSLNPASVGGMCGRLRCCLSYEHEQYVAACKKLPRRRKWVKTPQGEGKIIDLLPLRDLVVVQIEDRRVEVSVEEIEVIPKK